MLARFDKMTEMPGNFEKPAPPPAIEQLPPTSVASPSELRPRNASDMRWYKPSLGQTLQLLGWRWVYFLPAAVMILALGFGLSHLWFLPLLIGSWKLMVIAIVVPTGYAIKNAKDILRNRKEPFCIHCGYDLSGLPDNHTCPECGESYNFRLIEEYKRDPQWFIDRYYKHRELPPVEAPFEARISKRPRSRDGT